MAFSIPGYADADKASVPPRFMYSSTEPEGIYTGACKEAAIFVLGKLKMFGLVLAFVNVMLFHLIF